MRTMNIFSLPVLIIFMLTITGCAVTMQSDQEPVKSPAIADEITVAELQQAMASGELTACKPISDDDLEDNIKKLLEQRSSYDVCDRGCSSGDMIKASFTSDLEIPEDAPDSVKRMVNTDETWIMLGQMEMLPGASEALEGLKAGEEKTFEVSFPEGYYEPDLIGKTGNYTL